MKEERLQWEVFIHTLWLLALLGGLFAGNPLEGNAGKGARLSFPLAEGFELELGGEATLRHEDWSWFGTDYSFQFLRARVHARGEWEQLAFYVEPQYVAMRGLPDDAVLAAPAGPSGMGALYYAHNVEQHPDSIGMHQAWFELGDFAAFNGSLKAGRFTYASGMEHMNPADGSKFNALKTTRLGDRMISSFEWSAFARAFDGAQFNTRPLGDLRLTASWMYPTQGGWEKDFNESMDDVRIAALALTLPKDILAEGLEIGIFGYNYRDERSCTQRIDNCASGPVSAAEIDISTIGFHAVGLLPIGEGQIDYLLWAAHQSGDWYELKHRASALAVEAGHQWLALPFKPWLRAGWFFGAGDDDPADGEHGSFFQMAPGTRKYQLFPYYDLQNIEYAFAQLFLFPRKDVKLRLDYSVNRLAESSDRWYMGTGGTQNEGTIFGYLGRPSSGENELSREASIMLQYQLNASIAFELFYSHVWGGAVIEGVYPDDSEADYFSIETTFKF